MIRYTQHSQSEKEGGLVFRDRRTLTAAFSRANGQFETTHGGDRSLREEYVRCRRNNAFTKGFLDKAFPYFSRVTSFEGKPLKFIDYSLATPAATKPTVPPIDLTYTARVVEASNDLEMRKELERPFAQIAQSTEAYPVDFDDAWVWVYESRKDSAKRALTKNFVEDVDYVTLLHKDVEQTSTRGGHNAEKIYLTVDCFKEFCMMAGTDRGKQVRRYYLDIEKRFKSREYNAMTAPPNWAVDIMTRLANVSESLGGNIVSVKTDVDSLKAGHEDHETRLRQLEQERQALLEKHPFVIYVAQCTRLGYIKIGYTQRERVMERLTEINLPG
jgi:phage anti-repressor protein